MRGLSSNGSSNGRSKSTCSFCRSQKHQVSKCPHVPIVWESLQKGIIPLSYLQSVPQNTNTYQWYNPLPTYYTQGQHWGDLFKSAEKAYEKWERAQNRQSKKGGKRRTSKCGFCGETGHNRSKCTSITDWETKLSQANRNFRQWFYKEYVEQFGLSSGAIVSLDMQIEQGWQQPTLTKTITTLCTDITWNSVNLFATFVPKSLSYSDTCGGLKTEALGNVQNFVYSPVLLKVVTKAFEDKGVSLSRYGRELESTFMGIPLPLRELSLNEKRTSWGISVPNRAHNFEDRTNFRSASHITFTNVSVVSRAPQVLSADWIDGYSDEMSIIFKKYSMEVLKYLGILDHIDEWANKSS